MWAKALAAATVGGWLSASAGGTGVAFEFEILLGCRAAADKLNGHKKTVSESETVAGQQAAKITEMPKAKSGKPIVEKTFRSTRGSLLSRVPRFVNKFFG
jgi:hypothetical protein